MQEVVRFCRARRLRDGFGFQILTGAGLLEGHFAPYQSFGLFAAMSILRVERTELPSRMISPRRT